MEFSPSDPVLTVTVGDVITDDNSARQVIGIGNEEGELTEVDSGDGTVTGNIVRDEAVVNCTTAGVVCWGMFVIPSNGVAIDGTAGDDDDIIPNDVHDIGRTAGGGVVESGVCEFDTRDTTSEIISCKMLSTISFV